MRRLLLLAAALALAPVAIALAADRGSAGTLRATPVPLDRADRARTRVGALRYLGGWELASSDRRFGGFSALEVRGGRVRALADSGRLLAFPLPRRRGTLAFAATALPRTSGGADKGGRDSEAMAVDPASGDLWVSFESTNCILRYDAALSRIRARACPAEMAGWEVNGGAEAIVALADGRFLVFAEEMPEGGADTEALLFRGPPEGGKPPLRFRYKAPDGYMPTDAAQLPDGRLLVLNRRATLADGFSAVLMLVDPAGIRPGARIVGRELARLVPPLTVDNMEGLSIEQQGGRTILWMVSDDNHMPFQRTLLLRFALELPR